METYKKSKEKRKEHTLKITEHKTRCCMCSIFFTDCCKTNIARPDHTATQK